MDSQRALTIQQLKDIIIDPDFFDDDEESGSMYKPEVDFD